MEENRNSSERSIKFFGGKYGTDAIAASALLLFFIAVYLYFAVPVNTEPVPPEEAFAAGTSKDVPVYVIEDNEEAEEGKEAVELKTLVRGSGILKYSDEVTLGKETYFMIEEREALGADGQDAAESTDEAEKQDESDTVTADDESKEEQPEILYMKAENIAASVRDTVRETKVYVRTPVTIYKEKEGPAIASFAAKGSCLEVTGFDRLNEDGSVNKYKVAYGEAKEDSGESRTSEKEAQKENASSGDESEEAADVPQGYVYAKYMVSSQKKADKKYNGNGIYDQAKKAKYSFNLYGGKASHLDYYPYEKPAFEDNKFCKNARTMYLNCAAAAEPDSYIKIIKKTDCNAVVCDIKDGVLAYKSPVAKEWSKRSYKTAYTSVEKYKEGIDKLRDSGVYLIGRIVVFNDPIYAKDHPEDCIKYKGSTTWPSAYSRDVWEYNVRLAQEAVEEFGFNEIQFDYVRFPESSYEMSKSKSTKWRNKYDEEKGQAVQNFCFYAADQIHEAGAYFSIDVFGESVYGYMTAYGQYWPALSNIVDAISAMPYTDHMGGEGAWETPYATMKAWAKKAKKQQKKLDDPAAARTWITGYDTPYWAPEVNYGKKQLKNQVKALREQGLKGGFIPWNASSSLAKYRQYKAVWNKTK